jgi:hypothetical protein
MRALFVFVVAGTLLGQSEQIEFFEKKVRPVLVKSCQACHNSKLKTAELDLSSTEGIAHGGASGSLISKENPLASLLLKVVSYEERLKMPPTGKLPAEQLADLKTWVEMGGPLPRVATAKTPSNGVRKNGRNFTGAEKNYWAFQPVRKPSGMVSIDMLVNAKLVEKGLKPAAPADKLTLLRRATFDLTGLPPAEKEMADFLADNSPDAFAKVVDRLLASPRYGERWGRHWLDVARYADSTGNDEDHRYPYAWRYRDYVIDSFNQDVSYDQFLREQIAGDLMPAADGGVNRRGIVATGFLALGAKAIAQQDKVKMLYDVYDEQLDVMSKAVLGLTVNLRSLPRPQVRSDFAEGLLLVRQFLCEYAQLQGLGIACSEAAVHSSGSGRAIQGLPGVAGPGWPEEARNRGSCRAGKRALQRRIESAAGRLHGGGARGEGRRQDGNCRDGEKSGRGGSREVGRVSEAGLAAEASPGAMVERH